MKQIIIYHTQCYSDCEEAICQQYADAIGPQNFAIAIDRNAYDNGRGEWPRLHLDETASKAEFGAGRSSRSHVDLVMALALKAFPDADRFIYLRDEVAVPDLGKLLDRMAALQQDFLMVSRPGESAREDTANRFEMAFFRSSRALVEEAMLIRREETSPDASPRDFRACLQTALAARNVDAGNLCELLPELFDTAHFGSAVLELADQWPVGRDVIRHPSLTLDQMVNRILRMGPKRRDRMQKVRLRGVWGMVNPHQRQVLQAAFACHQRQDRTLRVGHRQVRGIKGAEIAMAAPRIYDCTQSAAIDMEVSEFADLHLDHFDTTRAEAVWLRIGDQRDPREAPFYYQAIRTAAVEAYSVPFSQLAPWLGPMPSTPILIFSIGRCGSTLFSQIAKVAGVATWSEPDTFTNLASDKNLRQDPDLRLRLARVALNDLAWKAQAEGGQRYFAVKLRSRVTHLCETLSSLNPDSKSLFIVREPVGWAKSFGQHFGADPRVLANNLSRMVSDIRKAKAGGLGIRVIDYADMKDRPGELCLELSGLSGKPFDQDELDAVMASDSQAGTTISRETGKELPPDFVPTFLKCLEERDPTLLQTPPSMWI